MNAICPFFRFACLAHVIAISDFSNETNNRSDVSSINPKNMAPVSEVVRLCGRKFSASVASIVSSQLAKQCLKRMAQQVVLKS